MFKVLKVDTESRDVIVWKEPSHFVSEPIFVANPSKYLSVFLEKLTSNNIVQKAIRVTKLGIIISYK